MSDQEYDNQDAQLEREARERLDNLPPDEILRRAHMSMLKALTAKAEAGTITHQEMAILRNMLKDNGMVLGVPPQAGDLPKPDKPADLPTYDNPDYEN